MTPVVAQALKDRNCTGKSDVPYEQQILGCSDAIKSGSFAGKDLADAFSNRGWAYFGSGNVDRAIADYDEAIRLEPADACAFNNRGVAYDARGDLDRAITDFDQALQLDPTYAVAMNNRGKAYQAKNEIDHAIADYGQAIRLNPVTPWRIVTAAGRIS